MKVNKLFYSLIILFLALGMNAEMFAQRGMGRGIGNGNGNGFGNGYGPGNGYVWQNMPNMTDDQKTKIDALRVTHLKEMTTLRNQIREKQAHLTTLESADKADMNAINKTIDEISDLRNKKMKQRASHRQDVRNILTEEQRAYFDAHQNRRGKGFGRGMGRGNGCGNGYGTGRGWRN